MKVRMAAEQPNREAFIDSVKEKYHFSEEDRQNLCAVYDRVCAYTDPYAAYRINSRMRGNALIDEEQSAIVAMTLGEGVDRLQEYYEREHALAESYMTECIANEILLAMYADFNRNYPRFHRRYVKRYVFIGDEIPLPAMKGLLDEVYHRTEEQPAQEGEITANEYGVLFPSKSVVFFALLSDNPNQICGGICMHCPNIACENRMQEDRQIRRHAEAPDEVSVTEMPQQLNYGYRRIFEGVHL